jgi:hypothetical protein
VAVPKVFWHSLIVAEEAKRNNINFISYTMWDVPNLDYFGMFLIRLPRVTLMFYVLSDCSSLHVYIYNYIYIFFLYLCTYTDMHVYNYIYTSYACVSVWVCWCVCVQHVIMYLYNLYNKYTHMYIFLKLYTYIHRTVERKSSQELLAIYFFVWLKDLHYPFNVQDFFSGQKLCY